MPYKLFLVNYFGSQIKKNQLIVSIWMWYMTKRGMERCKRLRPIKIT